MTDEEIVNVILKGKVPKKSTDIARACAMFKANIGKIRDMRARMDELFGLTHKAERMVLGEQARNAHFQSELTSALESLYECQKDIIKKDVRMAELLAGPTSGISIAPQEQK